MTYFCVHAVFYDSKVFNKDGAEILKTKTCNVKPKNQFIQNGKTTAFIFWMTSEERAKELCDGVNSGEIYIDDLISFYEECLPKEGRAA
jgi:hypothetical protein